MSTKKSNKNTKNYKSIGGLDYKRISVLFVDSIFKQVSSSLDPKDPLNSNARDFYSKQPRKSSQEQLKTPSKKNIPDEIDEFQNKPKTNYKPSSVEKSNNYNNSDNQKKLIYNTSAKSIERKKKDKNKNIDKNKIIKLN